jgi:hypothetical protein
MAQIKEAKYEFDEDGWSEISAAAKDLIARILVRCSLCLGTDAARNQLLLLLS